MTDRKNHLLNEILVIIIASLFLGLILALNLKWPILTIEPMDYLQMSGLALLMVIVFVGAQKIAAHRLECGTKTNLLGFKRYGFKKGAVLPFRFPLWLVLPLLLFLITGGMLKWLSVLDTDISPKSTKVRRKIFFLEEADVTKITAAGPIAIIFLGIISKIIGLASGIQNFTSFAVICALFAFLSLIPIGMGFKLFSSSRFFWLFLMVFSFILLAMMKTGSLFVIITAALIFAAMATVGYYMQENK
ncbi:MAG: hypothetical protein WC475_03630 [Candidatus Paceibacterota bacterium]